MRVVVYAALCGALILCVVARRAARRVSPPVAAAGLCLVALAAAAAWMWNLALLAGTVIGRVNPVAAYGHWSEATLAARDPVPVPAAVVAGVLVTLGAGSLTWCVRGAARELWRAWGVARGCSAATADGVIVVADSAPRAVAVPGVRGRVLITTAMISALTPDERRVLLAHEQTHLRWQHGLLRLGVRLAAAVLPLLRPLAGDCDFQLERWADETAARVVGDRRLAARALGRAALAGHRGSRGAAALSPAFAEHGVVARVEALLREPPRYAVRTLALPLTVLMATALLTVQASRDLEALFELAMRGWSG